MSGRGIAPALLLGLGAWLAAGPRGVRVPSIAIRGRGPGPGHRPRRRRSPRPVEVDVAGVLTEVASRLRAGAAVDVAWFRTLERTGIGGPVSGGTAALLGAREPDHGVDALARYAAAGADPQVAGQVAAARAAGRLARRTGAPLADVLEACAAGLAEAAQADAARRIALAGPASTARLLGWLPVAGLGLGAALGADPLAVLLDGGSGTAAGLAGIALLVLGRQWTAVLVARARREPSGTGSRRPRRGGWRAVGSGRGGG